MRPLVLQASIASLQTTTLGEMLITPDAAVAGNVTVLKAFTGSVMVLTGENDYSVCGFSCNGKDNPVEATLRNVFISANPERSEARVVPGTGHNLNPHLNAAETYGYMIDWVRKL
ncbi:hypothetical protein CEP54_005452 [Fusarium duplospermum]|uniref:Uncharacterized protein n=1 Tax=Fusarium duplospermum TaxID=1325734 RepID=A0A428QC78_9HYPO|nr:hypothetical protein CEP54_005452 [Fusarium duplospermum]